MGRIEFGRVIQTVMRDSNRSLSWVARQVGVERSTVARYLDGSEPLHAAGERIISLAAAELRLAPEQVREQFSTRSVHATKSTPRATPISVTSSPHAAGPSGGS